MLCLPGNMTNYDVYKLFKYVFNLLDFMGSNLFILRRKSAIFFYDT
ncbi:hypothetical protein ATHEMM101B_21430 [Atlantibacter hermannii]